MSRSRGRWALAVAVVGGLLGATTGTGVPVAAAAKATTISWHSAGDSYSSGEGVSGNIGACAQSDNAFGPAAAKEVAATGWTVTPNVFTACTGHLAEDFLNARPGSAKKSLAAWAKEQGLADGRSDVLTMSFGGNDIGFAEIVFDCMRTPLDDWVVGGLAGGCDDSEPDLTARADALVAPTKQCTGGRLDSRRDASFDWGCDLLLDDRGTPDSSDDRRGSIVDFYRMMVDEYLTPRGRLVVVGYPSLFAPTDEWGRWNAFACADITRGDAQKLQRLAKYLDDKLRAAVASADDGSGRILYVSRYDTYRNGSHELCGKGADWINGVSKNRGSGIQWARYQTSFHPNALGHAVIADQVADYVTHRDWTSPEPITKSTLENLVLPGSVCDVLELKPGDHRLKNGRYVERKGTETEVSIDVGDVAVGDLDGDGIADGALSLGCSNGVADHVDLVMVVRGADRTLLPVHLTEDRPDLDPFDPNVESLADIGSLSIETGELRVGMRWTFQNDPLCCATSWAVGHYRVQNGAVARTGVDVTSDQTRTERMVAALNAGEKASVDALLSPQFAGYFDDAMASGVQFTMGGCVLPDILEEFRYCDMLHTDFEFPYRLAWEGGLGPEVAGDEPRVATVLETDDI